MVCEVWSVWYGVCSAYCLVWGVWVFVVLKRRAEGFETLHNSQLTMASNRWL